MLSDVVNNNNVKESNVSFIDNYNEMMNKINNKKRRIQRQLNEIKERIENRQDIRDGLVKEIDHLNYIENLKDYSDKENITTRIEIPYNLMLDFHKSIELKHGHNYHMSNTIITLISKFNESFLGKQQHTTSSYLKYKKKEPRLDVLLKLKQITDLIYSASPEGIVSHGLIKQAVSEELNADPRTADNYFLCIKGFAEQMMKEELGYYSTWNLRGLHEAIGEKLQMRYSKQNNLGMENAQ